MTAYGREIKAGFAFFDEIFHQPSLAVKFDLDYSFTIKISPLNNDEH